MSSFHRVVVIFTFIFNISCLGLAQTAPAANSNDKKEDASIGTKPNYLVSGFARLSSNSIDRGLTLTNGGFNFTGQFLINLGSQFKFGFWGSNISNLGAPDDNLWVKYIGEIFVDLQPNLKLIFYVHDDHFYKSSFRDGKRVGIKFDNGRYRYLVESQDNYEGTQSNALYVQGKFIKKYTSTLGIELGAGFTSQHSGRYSNYIDLSGVGFYKPFEASRFEAGVTLPSNTTQFGSRSKIGYFVAFELDY